MFSKTSISAFFRVCQWLTSLTKGEWYALELAATAVSIPYCYLQRETDYATSNIFDPPQSFLAEIQLGKYPLFPLVDKEVRYYVQIE